MSTDMITLFLFTIVYDTRILKLYRHSYRKSAAAGAGVLLLMHRYGVDHSKIFQFLSAVDEDVTNINTLYSHSWIRCIVGVLVTTIEFYVY